LISRDANGSLVWYDRSAGVWTSFGDPPGGTTSSPSAAGVPGGQALVVVRGASNLPWYRIITSGGSLTPWSQLGTMPIASAPAAAISTLTGQIRMDVFALDDRGHILLTTNTPGYPFQSWSEVPGGGVSIASPTATWIPAVTGGASPYLVVAVVATNYQAATNRINFANGAWEGWVGHGLTCDSAVAVNPPSDGSAEPQLTAQYNGNYWVSTPDGSWNSIGHP
jgi:hypothetical protein